MFYFSNSPQQLEFPSKKLIVGIKCPITYVLNTVDDFDPLLNGTQQSYDINIKTINNRNILGKIYFSKFTQYLKNLLQLPSDIITHCILPCFEPPKISILNLYRNYMYMDTYFVAVGIVIKQSRLNEYKIDDIVAAEALAKQYLSLIFKNDLKNSGLKVTCIIVPSVIEQ